MKKLSIISTLALFFMFLSMQSIAQNQVEQAPKGDIITIKVFFHCANGKAKLEQELPIKRGIFSATANLQTKEVVIDYDPAVTDKAHIVEAIEQIGYQTEFSDPNKKINHNCSGDHH